MNSIRPIETRYAGHRFRSRTEARWAVYFDAEGIEWNYEREGYELNGLRYLPDFWLPQVGMFAEVKPHWPDRAALAKIKALPRPCLVLDGLPAAQMYFAWDVLWGEYESSADGVTTDAGHVSGGWVSYDVSGHHDYMQEEHRFFSCCGCCDATDEGPQRAPECGQKFSSYLEPLTSSIVTALSARFDGTDELVKRKTILTKLTPEDWGAGTADVRTKCRCQYCEKLLASWRAQGWRDGEDLDEFFQRLTLRLPASGEVFPPGFWGVT